MNLSLSVFILFFINYNSPISAENPKFTTCAKTIQCGNITNITYPFYDGKTRPGYCGYPGLLLDCSSETPQITIFNQKYNLLGINKTANTINISMTNFNSSNACLNSLLNTTIDLNNFRFSAADQNLTFFYDCGTTFPILSLKRQCNLLGSSLTGYYMTPKMLEKYAVVDLSRNCRSILIPILQSEADMITASVTFLAIVNAFLAGFELGLVASITGPCSSCVGSGGICGYDSGKFVCYCANSNFNSMCGGETVNIQGKHNVTGLAVGASVGALFLVIAFVIGGRFLVLHRRKKKLLMAQQISSQNHIPSSGNDGLMIVPVVHNSSGLPSNKTYDTSNSSTNNSHSISSYASDERASTYFGVPVFDYSELKLATDDFNNSKELGSGGYGKVYYGKLPGGREVAVKCLYETSFRRMEQFMNEIEILARMRHKNLVTLYGCTSRKSQVLVLVYEYVPNGTVADHLHGKHAETAFLSWRNRLSIAVETAEALAYLHRSDVIHRDVKTTNILLDNDFHVKVADFGLSRLFPIDVTHVSTYPQGTPGYVDPEYYNCFRLTGKSDVYSFGVILIELISSMQAVDGSRQNHVNLASMALDRIQNQALHELVDPKLGFDNDNEMQSMVKMVAELGFRCLQHDKDMRPTMEEVAAALREIQSLEGNSTSQEGMGFEDDVGLLNNIQT
ncbi:hypothetical protein V2J09_023330 [Rumex salicifolius]